MTFDIFQVDAFSDKIFYGNPACVVPLNDWLSDDLLLNIAKENAVSETAFFILSDNEVKLRWFTPDIEIDLCGHATLAVAHVLHDILNCKINKIVFKTLSGNLYVYYKEGVYYLDLPSRIPEKSSLPYEISSSLSLQPSEVFKSRDYMLVYDTQKEIEEIKINRSYFDQINLGHGGVIVTAKGSTSDFVSRYFTPQATILEDSVTGSAHCTLIPFWSSRLCKKELEALQISKRGGKLLCRDMLDRVIIGGEAKIYSKGEFTLR